MLILLCANWRLLMTRTQVIKHFGGKASIARALGISYAAVQQWGERVPELRQHQLEKITQGLLKAEDSDLTQTTT